MKPAGSVAYEILKRETNEILFAVNEDVAVIPNASTQQVTMEKILPLTRARRTRSA